MQDRSPATSIDLDALESALSHDDGADVPSLLRGHEPEDRDRALKLIAEQSLNTRRWSLAAAALSRVLLQDNGTQLQLNLARNFAALEQFRPAVYAAVAEARTDSRFQIAASATGTPTIHYSDTAGRATSFSIDNDPLKGVAALFARLRGDMEKGAAISLCGIGDGYLLNALAQRPPKLFMAMQQTVHVIEPMPAVLVLCMMIHDYSAIAGPIRQERFRWFVGPAWEQQVRDELLGDLLTPFPTVTVNQGLNPAAMAAALGSVREQLSIDDAQRQAEVEAHYAAVTRDEWTNLFSSFPARPPRVLLITTRFSTVLQYSTRDAAQAFGQLGWESHVVIEPSDWQRCSGVSIRKILHEFKPDFVFQIDHLRAEHGDLFPPELPFACWIQDHLPNLCNSKAGPTVGVRDYVLSGMGSLFVQQHNYPRRQVVDLPQLSRVPMRPTEWSSDGEDIIYVSNWSKSAGEIVPALLSRFDNPQLRAIVEKCCSTIVERYASGGEISTHYDVRLILSQSEKQVGIAFTDEPLKDSVINTVFDRLNNTLYRHQALKWAAEIAQSQGLQFALYGRGWESNPVFAPYARGPVAPGEDLERLTRASRINLQLEPYACFSHARLLAGLFAGGFYLVRDNPFNHLTQELLNFVDRVFDASVCSVAQARATVKDHYRDKLEDMLVRCACLGEQVDPIGMVRDWQRGGTLIAQATSLPRIDDVLFDSKASLEVAVKRFVNNPELRYDISTEQRQNTQSRLSYRAGLERVTRAIGKLISSEGPAHSARAA